MEQPENQPADAANIAAPMPSIWRRSVGLALFFTILGPAIGTLAMLSAISFLFFNTIVIFPSEIAQIGLRHGTPFAAVCGVIVAIRAAFIGKINFGDAFGAALIATVIILAGETWYSIFYLGTDPEQILPSLFGQFVLFGAPSVFAAVICRWLYYWLFWPREKENEYDGTY